MTIQLQAGLFHLAAGFVGQFSPFQAIEISPGRHGLGVFVAATDGNTAFVALDRHGTASCNLALLPEAALVKAAAPIKTAKRTLILDTEENSASVFTHRKTTTGSTLVFDLPVVSTVDLPPLRRVLQQVAHAWDTPAMAPVVNSGRYQVNLLLKTLEAAGKLGDLVTLHGWDGGPIRVEAEGSDVLLLVMPTHACVMPGAPPWLEEFCAAS